MKNGFNVLADVPWLRLGLKWRISRSGMGIGRDGEE